MAERGSRTPRRTRTDTERARLYAARTAWHAKLIRRRRRDSIVAALVGTLIVAGAVVSQTVHAQVTAPEPEPTKTTSPSETPSSGIPSPVPTTSAGTTQTPSE